MARRLVLAPPSVHEGVIVSMLKSPRRARRVLAVLASLFVLVLLAPTSPGLANRRRRVLGRRAYRGAPAGARGLSEELARVVAELEDAEDRMPDAEDAVTAASEELAEAERKDEELAARLTSAENAEKELQTQIDDGTDQIEDSEQAVVGVARRAYQNSGVTSDLAMLLQRAESDNGLDGLTRVDSAVRSQQRTITQLGEQRAANVAARTAPTRSRRDLRSQGRGRRGRAREGGRGGRRCGGEVLPLDDLISQKDSAAQTIEDNRPRLRRSWRGRRRSRSGWRTRSASGRRTTATATGRLPGDGFLRTPRPGIRSRRSTDGCAPHPISGRGACTRARTSACRCGQPVYAAADGVVVSSVSRRLRQPGRPVARESNGASIATTYNHNTRNVVSAGQSVEQGDTVAMAGTTGSSTGATCTSRSWWTGRTWTRWTDLLTHLTHGVGGRSVVSHTAPRGPAPGRRWTASVESRGTTSLVCDRSCGRLDRSLGDIIQMTHDRSMCRSSQSRGGARAQDTGRKSIAQSEGGTNITSRTPMKGLVTHLQSDQSREGRANLTDRFALIFQGRRGWSTCSSRSTRRARGRTIRRAGVGSRFLHKQEILKISQKIKESGKTLVPLELYFDGSRVKVEIAIAKGKKDWDKRQALREKQDKREAERAMKSSLRRR